MDNIQKIANSISEIGKGLLKDAYEKSDGDNIVISPVSLILCLALAYEAADGDTKEEIKRLLSTELPEESIRLILSELQFKLTDNDYFNSANAVIVANNIKDFIHKKYIFIYGASPKI